MKVPRPPATFNILDPMSGGGDVEATGVYTIDVGLTWRFGDHGSRP